MRQLIGWLSGEIRLARSMASEDRQRHLTEARTLLYAHIEGLGNDRPASYLDATVEAIWAAAVHHLDHSEESLFELQLRKADLRKERAAFERSRPQ